MTKFGSEPNSDRNKIRAYDCYLLILCIVILKYFSKNYVYSYRKYLAVWEYIKKIIGLI